MSPRIGKYAGHVKVLGQPPLMVELFDDKEYVNNALRAKGSFTMPLSWSLENSPDVLSVLKNANLPYPIVGKPVRGRGSQGVKVCNSESELLEHINALFKDSPAIMLEEYLAGEEVTVTVMPPSPENQEYWALPVVTRFNHIGGIAPYNGVVAVTANSRVITDDKAHANPHYHDLSRECEQVAKFLHVTAPIRIDARRFRNGPESKFALFDINMKPVGQFIIIKSLTP
jgi:D-alanine-D-alanine ligase-like ATP-grasp enzyme